MLDCVQEGCYDALSPVIEAAVRNGSKLSSEQKAVLSLLRDARRRVLLTLAYVANRCRATGFSRAVVIMFFKANGVVGHANMILLQKETEADALSVSVYEPNGTKAALQYATEARFLTGLSQSLVPLVRRAVSLRFVGSAMQTFLGQRIVRRSRKAIAVMERGYPVCEAVVLWLFHRYIEADADLDLADFEASLLKKGRRVLKQELLSWILAAQAWVDRHYVEEMKKKLTAIFRQSNVTQVTLRFGPAEVVWSA